jgi:hypothetical protein
MTKWILSIFIELIRTLMPSFVQHVWSFTPSPSRRCLLYRYNLRLYFLHGFHHAIAYSFFLNNAIVYPEDSILSYAAMEWLQETGGGDWWAQILAGSQRCPEDDRPGGMIHHAFLPNNSVQMKIIQYWLLLIDWTISVIFYILITIVRGDRKSLHVQHFLEPTVMDLEKSWNFTTGGWCTLMYPCALSGCLFQQ